MTPTSIPAAVMPDHCLRIIAAVRRGEQVRRAVAAEGYHVDISALWRRTVPGFAAALDDAKAHRQATRGRADKLTLLAWLATGKSAAAWLAGPGRVRGCTEERIAWWRRTDPWFRAEHDRALGATRRAKTGAGFPRLLSELRGGATLEGACKAAGLSAPGVRRWKASAPALYVQVRAARDAGRVRRGRERAA